MKYKITAGEWVNVYATQTLIIDTNVDLEKASPEQIKLLLEDGSASYEIEREDFDWTTEEHDDWDKNGIKVIEKLED